MEVDVSALLSEIGPAVDAAEIRQYEDNTWMIAFDEEFAIGVEIDETREVLVFSADLGTPAPGCETDCYKLLLQVAVAWREMGGIRMGLDPADDAVVQIQDLPLAGLEHDALRDCLLEFTEVARNGRKVIASMVAEEQVISGQVAQFSFIRA